MPFVHHPDFEDDVREVTDKQLDEYTEAGWKRVPQKDEKVVAAGGTPPRKAASKKAAPKAAAKPTPPKTEAQADPAAPAQS